LVVGRRQVADWLLPPPALARRPAAVVLAQYLLPPPAVRRRAVAAWRDGDRVVEEVGSEDLLPPPPPADKHPAAVAWRDRDLVVGGRQVADWPLPPPAVRRAAAAAWRDQDMVVRDLGRGHLLPPPP